MVKHEARAFHPVDGSGVWGVPATDTHGTFQLGELYSSELREVPDVQQGMARLSGCV